MEEQLTNFTYPL